MDNKDFESLLLAKPEQFAEMVNRQLPVKIGVIAESFFKNNFTLQGFLGGGLQPWIPAKRLSSGAKDAPSNRPTLFSSNDHMYKSINHITGNASATVVCNVPYAAIHNDGGTIHPSVTPAMRGHAWKEFFAAGGTSKAKRDQLPPEAAKWKALALTKKKNLNINIPRRQFMGDSPELRILIQQTIENGLNNILNK